ncbi:MAG: hypothetical protein QW561_02965 [Candidatus Aenigmatarchaeota archaeon]
MRKVLPVILLIFVILCHSSVLHGVEKGRISGKLKNGSGGNVPEQMEIVLIRAGREGEKGEWRTKSNKAGNFVFDGIPVDPESFYIASTKYKDIEYRSRPISFGKSKSQEIELFIYDTTPSVENIEIATEHLIMQPGDGFIQITDLIAFINKGNRTVIGEKEVSQGKKEVIRIPLPEGSKNVSVVEGLMECCAIISPSDIVDTMPFAPGVRQVAITYQIPYSLTRAYFSKPVLYNTARIDIFVLGEKISASSGNLSTKGLVDIFGKKYLHLTGSDIKKGENVQAEITGLSISKTPIKWIAAGVVILFSLFVIFIFMRKTKTKGKPLTIYPKATLSELEMERKKLLNAIAELDDKFEEGKIDPEEYKKIRKEKKELLLEITTRIKKQMKSKEG